MQHFTCEWCGSAIGYDGSANTPQISCPNCGGPVRLPPTPPPMACPPADDGDFFEFLNQSEPRRESSPRKRGDGDIFDFLTRPEAGRTTSLASSSKIPGRRAAPIDLTNGITALVCIAVLFFLSVEVGHALARDSHGRPLDELLSGVFAVINCLLLAGGVAVIWGLKTACPKCKGLWARQVARTKHLGSTLGVATITRTDRHFSGYSLINQVGSTRRDEQVLVMRSRHRHYCRCRWCGNRWSFVSLTERQGW